MPKLFVKFTDGSEKILENVTGAGFENGKLLTTQDSGEKHYDGVATFKLGYQEFGRYFPDPLEITED